MLIVLSPSKTLDFDTPLPHSGPYSQPRLLAQSETLIKKLRRLSEADLSALMGISPKLAALNAARYRAFTTPLREPEARPALYAFKGDVYEGLDAHSFTRPQATRAEKHLRMLSGLYGILRPLDLILPYRLEMGTALPVARTTNLYGFWRERITRLINEDLAAQGDDVLVNLASREYFTAIRPAALAGRIITPHFKEKRGNRLSVIGLFAKRARGEMAAYMLREKVRKPDDLKGFTGMGYAYDADLSSETDLVFVR